jgi:hypothetical protein
MSDIFLLESPIGKTLRAQPAFSLALQNPGRVLDHMHEIVARKTQMKATMQGSETAREGDLVAETYGGGHESQ